MLFLAVNLPETHCVLGRSPDRCVEERLRMLPRYLEIVFGVDDDQIELLGQFDQTRQSRRRLPGIDDISREEALERWIRLQRRQYRHDAANRIGQKQVREIGKRRDQDHARQRRSIFASRKPLRNRRGDSSAETLAHEHDTFWWDSRFVNRPAKHSKTIGDETLLRRASG